MLPIPPRVRVSEADFLNRLADVLGDLKHGLADVEDLKIATTLGSERPDLAGPERAGGEERRLHRRDHKRRRHPCFRRA